MTIEENLTPQYRIEEYLEAIVSGWADATEVAYPEVPSWRIEEFLDAFITYIWEDGDHPRHPCPEPVWRIEECLRAIYDVMTGAATPWAFPLPATTRIEEYLAAIHAYLTDGTELPVPEPVWRIEQWLAYALDAVKQGGDVTKTVSGTMVHITDALAKAALSVLVDIDPVQDLHGYDNPWPAGGGVNKVAPRSNGTTENNGVTISATDGIYTLSGTSTGIWLFDNAIDLPVGEYAYALFNGGVPGGSIYIMDASYNVLQNISISSATRTGTFTLTTNATTLRIRGTTGNTYNSVKLSPMIVSGSTVPTAWSPCSNICPITGWTGAKVTRTGKNLVDANTVWAAFLQPDGTFYHPLGNVYFYIPQELVGKQLTFSAYAKADANNANLRVGAVVNGTNNNGNLINNTTDFSLTSITFTPSSTNDYIVIHNSGINGTYKSIQLELGSTATAYEPYQSNTYDITFPSEAGTVYGGTVDVVSGVLTVDRAMVTVGNSGWTFYSPYIFNNFADKIVPQLGDTEHPLLCSMLRYGGAKYASQFDDVSINQASNPAIYIKDTSCANAAEYYAKYKDAEIVYYLATPITYQLTPQEVQMLLGENNIWASSGDTVSVTYYAEGNANALQSLNILLGGNYSNPKTADDVSDKEALEIILGGNK